MSNKKTNVNDMSSAIMDILENYGDLATKVIREESEKCGKKAVKELKTKSPKATGKYRKGWTQKTTKTYAGAGSIVYNKDAYQLTHLLEKGHMMRNGNFKKGEPHIAPVEKEISQEFFDNVKRGLKQ